MFQFPGSRSRRPVRPGTRAPLTVIVSAGLFAAAAATITTASTSAPGPAPAADAQAPPLRAPSSAQPAPTSPAADAAAARPPTTDATTDAWVAEARQLAASFMGHLKRELQAALAAGGPVNAIDVCRDAAPQIGADLGARSGWSVGRTALRVRNPRNAPTAEERAVLLQFQRRLAAGESPQHIEAVRVVEEGPVPYVHYMRAIPTGGVCLACHGTDVSDEVTRAIRSAYPADAATGFSAGDLRGAFTFVRPLPPPDGARPAGHDTAGR